MPILTDNNREKNNLSIQMTPMMDIVFNTLIVFMALAVFNQLETEISISVPKAKESKSIERTAGEIIVNITKTGEMVVNERRLTYDELKTMLKRVSTLFPNQPVIIRADEKTYHKYVISVLDACAAADIWNISFATVEEEKEEEKNK